MALKTFEEQIWADPQNGFAYFGRGIAQIDLGKMEEAFADLSQAILLAGSDPMAQYYYLMRGFISYNQFDFENAINDWEQAATINPNNADVLYNLGLAYHEQGKYKATMQSLLVVLAQDIPVDFKVEAAKELVDNAEALLLLSENQEQARLAIEDFQAFIAWGQKKMFTLKKYLNDAKNG